jgi:surface polysaccharide O-acyltransferase-like enzyme
VEWMLDTKRFEKRNPAMDIIRIVAAFTVLSVHFFLNNGFYYETVQGAPMYIMSLMRTLFSVCVPLFLILTGYLMSHKTLSKSYYKGISKTLIIFVLATLACMLFKTFYKGDEFSLSKFILGTLDFTGANYSWYIEMYIGLFLIAPFLNLAYNGLKSKKSKQILVFTFVAITILPTLFNIFNFDSVSWWTDPTSNDTYAKLIPSWWMGFYPVTYYFTGCYLREFGMKIKTRTLLITFLFAVFLFGSFNFFRSYGTTFKSGIYVYWYGFEPYVLSSFLFVLLSRIKIKTSSNKLRFALWKVSDLALGIYLISYIFDNLVYKVLNTNVTTMTSRLPFYFVTVPLVFVLSAISSAILNIAAKGILLGWNKLTAFVKAQKKKNKGRFWQDMLFIALMVLGLIFAFWKCFYGFGGNDEAFYLTIPHRLTMGDALIKDEWHLSQLSSFLLLPFVSLYTSIVGSTEGIILTARFCYVIFHAVICSVIYLRTRKYGVISAFASALFFVFTPYNIMALSYNTMGLDLVAVTGVVMGTASYKKKLPIILSGLAFAGAVLCSPYLAAAYILFGICVALHYALKKKNFKFVISSELFSIKTFLWFTVGAAILAVAFLIFALSRVSVSEIIEYLPNLMTDPEHPQLTLGYKILTYFKSIYSFDENFKYAVISYFAMLVVLIVDKKRKQHRSLYLIVSAALTIFTYVLIIPKLTTYYYNAIMVPIIFVGITSYILCDKKPRNLFASLFVLGIIYSVAISFSSNQWFYVIAMAWSASNLASYVFVARLLKEMRETEDNFDYAILLKRSAFVAIAFVIVLQIGLQIKCKAEHCFWESSISSMTEQISDGPAKGIYTTTDNCDEYELVYSDLQYYKKKESDNVLCLTPKTWTYLALNDYSYGTLSAWISDDDNAQDSNIARLKTYYSLNPDKTPKYIYIPKSANWDFSNIYIEAARYGYSIVENDISYKLSK